MSSSSTDSNTTEVDFDSLDAWLSWQAQNKRFMDDAVTDEIRQWSKANGIIEPVTGRTFAGPDIDWNPANYRESGLAGGLISRHRAALLALSHCVPNLDRYETKIYAAEAITELAFLLRGRFAKFIGSEYAASDDVKHWLYPINSEDLTALSFASNAFDVVLTTEVLEHVPDLDVGLSEMFRVLKPGGWHVGTCPFLFNQQASIVKTRIENGQLVHLTEPEWHGNPMSEQGSLVFELPGWDILDRAKAVGFSKAVWRFVQSARHGIASNSCGGVFVLCLQK
ncbi:SAM-dependent methyltransferase [Bosea sp. OAE506]|uniref:class I SAM-dependent methyltransferase n=1 Tax=Bosea sp. OAE506 TaxID=2663870 RepID=UPI0019E3D55C